MKNNTDKKLKIFSSVINKYVWELAAVKQDLQRAKVLLQNAENLYNKMLTQIHAIEDEIRYCINSKDGFSPGDMQFQRAYLSKHNQKLKICDEDKYRAQQLVDTLSKQLVRQQVRIRGIEKVHDRRLSILTLEHDRRNTKLSDEMWLQRLEVKK